MRRVDLHGFKLAIAMGPSGDSWGSDDFAVKRENGDVLIRFGKDESPTKGLPVDVTITREAAIELARDILSAC